MLVNYQSQDAQTYQQIMKCIPQLKEYIEQQRILIDDGLRLVVWEQKADESCDVILLANFKTLSKANPFFILSNALKSIGLEGHLECEEVNLNHERDFHAIENSYYHVDSIDDIVRDSVVKFHSKHHIEPILEAETFISDEYQEVLNDELQRIKEYSHDYFTGNPCHYLFTSDNSDSMDASNYLVHSLVESHRLPSSMVHEVNFGLGGMWQLTKYRLSDNLPFCFGQTVRITFNEGFRNVTEQNRTRVYDKILNMIDEYGSTVLFIIHFNNSLYEDSRVFLKKDMNNLYIELTQFDLTSNEAKKYIIEEAYKFGVEPSSIIDMYISKKDAKVYSKTQLKNLLIDASRNRLQLPQFASYLDLRTNKIKGDNHEQETKRKYNSAMDELNQLIGLYKVKELIKEMVQMQKIRPKLLEQGISFGHNAMHCCFVGNPGTAKTTVARLLGEILKEEGILKTGVFVEATRKDLIGEYIGQTAPRIVEFFKKARGGVLFIDEAYSLVDGYGRKSYGDEAIATIVELMENYRHDTVVVFAGYPKEMEEFLSLNPGLKSRIPHMVKFSNYSTEDMVEIAQFMANEKGFEFNEEALLSLGVQLQNARHSTSFANGRTVRNMVESILTKHVIKTYQSEEMSESNIVNVVGVESVELVEESVEFVSYSYRKATYS
jgi:AAA+ superfamily predicted ATPase